MTTIQNRIKARQRERKWNNFISSKKGKFTFWVIKRILVLIILYWSIVGTFNGFKSIWNHKHIEHCNTYGGFLETDKKGFYTCIENVDEY